MAIQFNLSSQRSSIIKVIGVGGGGGNAVNNMFNEGITGVEFILCNTDMQALDNSPVSRKIQLGSQLTEGLGCGADPQIGQQAALESIEELDDLLADNTKMVFITAGMGGGTGTGGAPVLAARARELGILTVGIVTTPFTFEGKRRFSVAKEGLEELREATDSMVVINNVNVMASCKNKSMREAFLLADSILGNAARGIADIITNPGLINVDFADLTSVMKDGGTALMGMAAESGDNRAIKAIEEALASPLLDNHDIKGASGILLNISCSMDNLSMQELEDIGEYVQERAGDNAQIIIGHVDAEDQEEELKVTLIATGFNDSAQESLHETPSDEYHNRPRSAPNGGENGAQANQPRNPRRNEPVPQNLPFSQTSGTEPVEETRGVSVEEPASASSRSASPAERMRRLDEKNLNYHDAGTLESLEREPAYKRMGLQIEPNPHYTEQTYSRMQVQADNNGRHSLSDRNSYLYDNVD